MEKEFWRLSQVMLGETVRVQHLLAQGAIRRRLRDLGVIEGTKIQSLHRGPWGDPTAYEIRGSVIALREKDAANVIVEPVQEVRSWD